MESHVKKSIILITMTPRSDIIIRQDELGRQDSISQLELQSSFCCCSLSSSIHDLDWWWLCRRWWSAPTASETDANPFSWSSWAKSLLMAVITGGPSKANAVYTWIRDAPAVIFSNASFPVKMPPTPIMGSFPSVKEYMSLTASVDSVLRGAPLSPPASRRTSVSPFPGRVMVVFETIIPSIMLFPEVLSKAWLWVIMTLLMSLRSSWERSGEILSKTGLSAGRTEEDFSLDMQPRRLSKWLTAWRFLRPGVLGLETLITK